MDRSFLHRIWAIREVLLQILVAIFLAIFEGQLALVVVEYLDVLHDFVDAVLDHLPSLAGRGIQVVPMYQAIFVAAKQAIAYAKGVGQVVVERPVVLVALQVVVAGLVVPAALPVEHYQRVCSA